MFMSEEAILYTMGKNELGISVVCEQKITIVEKSKVCSKTEDSLREYMQNVLNNSKTEKDRNDVQLPFYKAHLYKETEKSEYIIIFHLYSKVFWTKNVDKNKSRLIEYFEETFPTKDIIVENGLDSLKIIEHVKRLVRVPISFDGTFKEDDHSWKNVKGNNFFEKFFYFWLIAPSVQWDFFDMLYQMYTFDIFHQGVISKCVHFLTIPTNVMLSMMFLAQFNLCGEIQFGGAFSVNFALLLLLIIGMSYIAMGFLHKCWQWGVVTFIVLTVLYMTGNLWYYSYRTYGNPWYNPTNWYTNPLIWSYIISFVQAYSHRYEQEIPPYISGASHWESLHLFLWDHAKKQESNVGRNIFRIAATFLFPVLSVSVAWFSWPHLIGTEIVYIMAGIGYKADMFKEFFIIAEKAERSGNPIINHFPKYKEDIDFGQHAQLLGKTTSDRAVNKDIVMRKLATTYIRGGVNTLMLRQIEKNEQKTGEKSKTGHWDIMEAVNEGFIDISKATDAKKNQ